MDLGNILCFVEKYQARISSKYILALISIFYVNDADEQIDKRVAGIKHNNGKDC